MREKQSRWPRSRSGQRPQWSNSGLPQDLCDFSPGFLTPTSNHPLRKDGSVSILVVSKCSWEETFLRLLHKFSPEVSSRDTASPAPGSLFWHLSNIFCPFRRGNETSWAALILTCPPKRGFFLHFWAKTQRREGRYESEPKQQKRKKEGKPKLKDGIAQKSQRKCKNKSFHTGLKQKKGRCLEGYGTTDNFTNNCEEMSRGKPWLPLTPAWAAKRGKWLLLPSWSETLSFPVIGTITLTFLLSSLSPAWFSVHT